MHANIVGCCKVVHTRLRLLMDSYLLNC